MKNRVEIARPSTPPQKTTVGFYDDDGRGPMILVRTDEADFPYARIDLTNLGTAMFRSLPRPGTYFNPLPPGTKITITVGEE